MSIPAGTQIDRYHIIEPLGRGGMAEVYKAYDNRLEREVAVKVIRRNAFSPDVLDRVLKRFDREAKSLAKLTHPNIVNIIDYGDFEGSPYLVMPYLPGGTLKQYLGKAMAYDKAAFLLRPIADALAFAHQKGIIHRDVKPGNILITEGGQPMLTDFGIARLLENEDGMTLTATGMGVGTPEYMSPEQGLGKEIDNRTDIYSLGVVLYELVTGRKPYTADTPMAVVLKQSTEPLPRPRDMIPDLPEQVEHLLFKSLAKDPETRYSSMEEFEQALEQLITKKQNLVMEETSIPLEVVGGSEESESMEDLGTRDEIDEPQPKTEQADPTSVVVEETGETFATLDQGEENLISSAPDNSGDDLGTCEEIIELQQMIPPVITSDLTSDEFATVDQPPVISVGIAPPARVSILFLILGLIIVIGAFFIGRQSVSSTIYFASNRSGNFEIYRLDNGQPIRVTYSGNAGSWDPVAFRPGILYFTSDRSGKDEIYYLKDSTVSQVTYSPGKAESRSPVFIDDTLYFVSNRSGKNEIWRIVNSKPEQVTTSPEKSSSFINR